MRVYDANNMPRCQWDNCKGDAISQVFTEDQKDNLFLCRIHRGVAVINLETTGKLRANQAKNTISTERPSQKRKDYNGPRPGDVERDWEKVAAQQADAAALPVESMPFDENDPLAQQTPQRAIVSDIPTPKPR